MQRFFLPPAAFSGSKIETIDKALLHQMRNVLRMKPGDQFIALDNSGYECICVLEKLDKLSINATIKEKRLNTAEPTVHITLYQALPKKLELFEWVLQKGTEIGVSRFAPMITERTERTSINKSGRLEKILKEAAEQSERGKIPEFKEVLELCDVFAQANGKQKILLHSRGDYPFLSKILTEQTPVDILIGPEGGFTEKEIENAEKNGFTICSLGPRVLRTETAGIVAASLLMYVWLSLLNKIRTFYQTNPD